jgi:RHS repeat-associated protein
VSDTYTYDAFGNLITSTGTTANNYMYTGEQYDPNSGFYYLRARYYEPSIGRFATRDSFGGCSDDSQSLNRYAYARNNPLSFSDPSGHFYSAIGAFAAMAVNAILDSIKYPYWPAPTYEVVTPITWCQPGPITRVPHPKGSYRVEEYHPSLNPTPQNPNPVTIWVGYVNYAKYAADRAWGCGWIQKMQGLEQDMSQAHLPPNPRKFCEGGPFWGTSYHTMNFGHWVVDSYSDNPFYMEEGTRGGAGKGLRKKQPIDIATGRMELTDKPTVTWKGCRIKPGSGPLESTMKFQPALYDRLNTYKIGNVGVLHGPPAAREPEPKDKEWYFQFKTNSSGKLTWRNPR